MTCYNPDSNIGNGYRFDQNCIMEHILSLLMIELSNKRQSIRTIQYLPLTVLNFDGSLTVYSVTIRDNDEYIRSTVDEPSKISVNC